MGAVREPDLELRKKLSRIAAGRGIPWEDATDIAGDVWLRTYVWSQEHEPSQEELEIRAFVSLRHAIIDYWASPSRVAAKRIAHVLANPQEPDPIVSWASRDLEVIGYRSWRGKPPLSHEEEAGCEQGLSAFLYSPGGLAGVPPASLSARKLLSSLLSWAGRPLSKSFCVSILASIAVVPRNVITIEEHHAVSQPPAAAESQAGLVWPLIASLPFRMRASLLLALDRDVYHALHESAEVEVHSALQDWPPPPPIEEVEVPWDDSSLAEKLGVTKNNLQVIRNRAREILRRGFGSLQEETA